MPILRLGLRVMGSSRICGGGGVAVVKVRAQVQVGRRLGTVGVAFGDHLNGPLLGNALLDRDHDGAVIVGRHKSHHRGLAATHLVDQGSGLDQ